MLRAIGKTTSSGIDVSIPKKLSKWRAACARVRAGTGYGKVLVIGDSTAFGANGSSVMAIPNHYEALASVLSRAGLNANQHSFFGGSATATRLTSDARISSSGFSVNGSLMTLGGGLITSTTNGATLTFTPRGNCDRFRVYYTVYGGSSTCTVQATGGTPVTIYSNVGTNGTLFNSPVFYVDVNAASLAANAVTITHNDTSSFFIVGIEAWDSTAKSINIANAGRWGSKSADWVSTANGGYSPFDMTKAVGGVYDLVIVKSGINDYDNTAAYVTNMTTLLDGLRTKGCDIILEVDNPATGHDQTYAQNFLSGYAYTYNLVFIDHIARMESYSKINSLGMMSDGLHPNSVGFCDMASFTGSYLLEASGN